MKNEQTIVKRINVLTSMIATQQDKLYDIALRDKHRKCIWEIHEVDSKVMAYYKELLILQWVLDDREDV